MSITLINIGYITGKSGYEDPSSTSKRMADQTDYNKPIKVITSKI